MKKILAIATSAFMMLSCSSCAFLNSLINSGESSSIDSTKGTPVTTEQANAALVKIKSKFEQFKAIKDQTDLNFPWERFTLTTKQTIDQNDIFNTVVAFSEPDNYLRYSSSGQNNKSYLQEKDLYPTPNNPDTWHHVSTTKSYFHVNHHYLNSENNYIAANSHYEDKSTWDVDTNLWTDNRFEYARYTSTPVQAPETFLGMLANRSEAFNVWQTFLTQYESAMLQLESTIPSGIINLGNGLSMKVVSNGEGHLYCEYKIPLTEQELVYEFENNALVYYKITTKSLSGLGGLLDVTIPPYGISVNEGFFYPDVCEITYPNLTNYQLVE